MNERLDAPAPVAPPAKNDAVITRRSSSMKIYLALVLVMIILAGLKSMLPLQLNQGQQTGWASVLIVAILGWIGLALTPRAGFPEMWAAAISNRQRLWLPAAVGLILGIVMFFFDLVSPLGTDIQTRFPDSLIVFGLAGLMEEIALHLFLTTLLIWLISGKLLKGRHQETVFWTVAAGIALLYWLLQLSAIRTFFPERFSVMLAIQILFVIVATITAGAYYFRKGGFLAALALRYGFYLVWHIIWGGGIGLVRYFSG